MGNKHTSNSNSSNMENHSDVSKKVKTSKEKPAPKGFKNVGDIHMDEKNTQALNVLTTQGDEEFVKHVFTGDKGQKLTYAEMRARYG